MNHCYFFCQVFGNCAVVALLLIASILFKHNDVPSYYRELLVNAMFVMIFVYPGLSCLQTSGKFLRDGWQNQFCLVC